MKTGTKALFLALCAVVLVASSIMGTIAYLSDTDEVVNTFTVGNVTIELKEVPQLRDPDSGDFKATIDDVTTGNWENWVQNVDYETIFPGDDIPKNPTVKINKGSESAYVIAKVTVDANLEKLRAKEGHIGLFDIVTGGLYSTSMTPAVVSAEIGTYADFIFYGSADNGSYAYYMAQKTVYDEAQEPDYYEFYYFFEDPFVKNTSEDVFVTLFEELSIPETWDNEDMAQLGGENGIQINVKAYAIQAQGFDSVFEAWEAGQEQFQ